MSVPDGIGVGFVIVLIGLALWALVDHWNNGGGCAP